MKKIHIFSEKYAFGGKNKFSANVKFLRIFWSDLVCAIGFLEAVDIDKLLILSRNDFKGLLTAQIILHLESVLFSVKQKGKHIC